MPLARRLLASGPAERALCWLAHLYVRLVHLTSRWETRGREAMEGLWESRTPFIIAFWHGRLMMMPYIWRRGVPVHALISHHRDGRLLSRTIAHFGYATIAGSSSKGALGAVRAMADRIEAGESVAITPDGPRGPRMRAALGVVKVAGLTGAPILPASYSIRRRRVLRSWDRFLLALPFSRGVYLVGRPIRVARDADEAAVEAARRAVEAALNALTAEADRRCGHAPVEPAPLPAAAETGAARP